MSPRGSALTRVVTFSGRGAGPRRTAGRSRRSAPPRQAADEPAFRGHANADLRANAVEAAPPRPCGFRAAGRIGGTVRLLTGVIASGVPERRLARHPAPPLATQPSIPFTAASQPCAGCADDPCNRPDCSQAFAKVSTSQLALHHHLFTRCETHRRLRVEHGKPRQSWPSRTPLLPTCNFKGVDCV